MKIAIPVNDNSITAGVCDSFGRAPYFLIYDTDSKQEVFIDNSAASSQGGAGIKAAQIIVDQKAEALLTPRCGQKAGDVLKPAGVKLYKTVGSSIEDTIKDFLEEKLSRLADTHPGLHNHGGR